MLLKIDVQKDPNEIQFEGNTIRITNIPVYVNEVVSTNTDLPAAPRMAEVITLLHDIQAGMILDVDHKINLIKMVRSLLNLGLRESKDLVELHCPRGRIVCQTKNV